MRQLRETPVRDLAWLLLSAGLLCRETFPMPVAQVCRTDADVARVARWLESLDTAPGPLEAFVKSAKSARLGHYAERLLHFYLSRGPGYRLLAAGLQIRDARRGGATLGECDFLVERAGDGTLLHWELAVKLYLHVPADGAGDTDPAGIDDASRWIGPNLADSLDAKLHRLVRYQLRLTDHAAAQAWLPAPGPWTPQALVKGWLFHPLLAGAAALPAGIAPDHARGWWGALATWEACAEARPEWRDACWTLLPRARWLAPARLPLAQALRGHAALHAMIASHWRDQAIPEPVMVAALRPGMAAGEGDAADGFECSRGFIVPAGWPARAQQRIAGLAAAGKRSDKR